MWDSPVSALLLFVIWVVSTAPCISQSLVLFVLPEMYSTCCFLGDDMSYSALLGPVHTERCSASWTVCTRRTVARSSSIPVAAFARLVSLVLRLALCSLVDGRPAGRSVWTRRTIMCLAVLLVLMLLALCSCSLSSGPRCSASWSVDSGELGFRGVHEKLGSLGNDVICFRIQLVGSTVDTDSCQSTEAWFSKARLQAVMYGIRCLPEECMIWIFWEMSSGIFRI